jgi:hypothetical protein
MGLPWQKSTNSRTMLTSSASSRISNSNFGDEQICRRASSEYIAKRNDDTSYRLPWNVTAASSWTGIGIRVVAIGTGVRRALVGRAGGERFMAPLIVFHSKNGPAFCDCAGERFALFR